MLDLPDESYSGFGLNDHPQVFSPDGRWAGTAVTSSSQFSLWDITAKKLIKSISLDENNGITCLAFNADASLVALGRADGSITLLSLPDLTVIATLGGHRWSVEHLAFSADGRILASTGRDGVLRLWSVQP